MTGVDQQPVGGGAGSTPSSPAASTVVPQRPTPALLRLVKRLPFTTFYVVVTLVLAIALGTLWSSIEDKSWYPDVSYGLPAFEDGRWLTLIWGCFFALNPFFYIYVAGAFAFLTGFSEWVLGTKRTVVICVVYQIRRRAAHRVAVPDLPGFRLGLGGDRATETDVGFSAGMLAVLSVASATVRPPWRLRLRLGIWAYVLFSIVFVGQMADAEHVIAVALSLPFSTRLAGSQGPQGQGPADPARGAAARRGRRAADRRAADAGEFRPRPAHPVRRPRGRTRESWSSWSSTW